jgi:hypothetical protein
MNISASYSSVNGFDESVIMLGRDLATSWSPVQGVLPNVQDLVNWSETESFMEVGKAQMWAVAPKEKKITLRNYEQ